MVDGKSEIRQKTDRPCRSCTFWDRYGSGKSRWCAVWRGTTRPGDGCDSWTRQAEVAKAVEASATAAYNVRRMNVSRYRLDILSAALAKLTEEGKV